MHQSDDSDHRFRQLVLELTMREVMNGLYELSLDIAYAHLDYAVELVPDQPEVAPPLAEVIPFPRLRRAVGE